MTGENRGGFFRKTGALIRKDQVRSRQNIPAMVVFFTLICLGCAFLFLSVVADAEAMEEIVTIGIVDKDGSFVSRLAIQMVSGNKEVKGMFAVEDFETEEEAYDAVYNGDIVGAIIFEEGYFSQILAGESSAVSVVVSEAVEVHALQLRDFAGTGEILIKVGEYGVGATWDPIMEATGDWDKAVVRYNKLSLEFASNIMKLVGSTVATEHTPYSGHSVSLVGHYVLMYATLLLSMLDIIFFDFIRWDYSRTLLSRLRTMGVEGIHIMASKVPRILLVKGVLLGVVLAVAGIFLPLSVNLLSVLGVAVFLIFNTCFTVCICTLTQGSDVGPAIICAIHFAGLFLCGGLVPYDMLPLAVTQTGSFTPVGIGAGLLAPILGGSGTALPFVLAAVYLGSAVLLSLGKIRTLYVKGSDPA